MQYYPMHHKPRKLSVIGAMKDIQQYKIMKAQVDLAPTLAEKARIEWDWKQKDHAKDVRIKELDIEKAERGEVEAKRALMTEILTESAQIAEDAFNKFADLYKTNPEEAEKQKTEYINSAIGQIIKKGPKYAAEFLDRNNNRTFDAAEVPYNKLMAVHAGFLKRKEMISLLAGARRVPEDVEVEAEYKPTTALTFEQRKTLKAIGPEKAAKAGVNYLLKDRSMVTSFDGGRTFRDEAGKDTKMPFDAVRISATVTGQELGMMRAQAQVPEGAGVSEAIGGIEVGEGGTGPYAMFAAAIDKLFGGLGADKLFGKKGFFPETQENRQVLRTIKQLGKSALMNSSRGAIWEQQRIDELFPDPDKLFTNPRTEAKKFITLRKTLLQEKTFNNSAILSSVTPKEVSDLRKANIEIDRLLALIGTGDPAGGLSAEDQALINKYAPKQ